MHRSLLPLLGETRDGVPLAVFAWVRSAEDLDPSTWIEVAGIRAPAAFDAVEWRDDDLVITYTIERDPQRDAFQVRGVELVHASDDAAWPPVTAADASHVRPDLVLQDVLGWFERLSRFDRLATVTDEGLSGPAPRARDALRNRRSASASDLDAVAKLYEEALSDPHRASPPADVVASELGVSAATASRRIREARKANKIQSKPSRGRKPTP